MIPAMRAKNPLTWQWLLISFKSGPHLNTNLLRHLQQQQQQMIDVNFMSFVLWLCWSATNHCILQIVIIESKLQQFFCSAVIVLLQISAMYFYPK